MSSYRKSFNLFHLLTFPLLLILLLSRTFRHVTHIIIILSQKKSVAEGYDTVGVGPRAEGYDLIKKFYIRDYTLSLHDALPISEERRVGKECKIGRASCRERV